MTYCRNLKYVKANNLSFGSYFSQHSGLQFLDVSSARAFAGNCFRDNTSLTTVIIRDSSIFPLTFSNSITNTPLTSGTGYVYVPENLIDGYKVSSNWSTIANQFRKLYIVTSESERQEKLSDESIDAGSMIVYDDGSWNFSTMTGTRYTIKGG